MVTSATSQGQLQTVEALATVPTKSRPIRLIRSGRPVSPTPESRSLLGQLPDEITGDWRKAEPQYVTEFSASASTATVTSATARLSVADLGRTENELLDEFHLGDEDNLRDEVDPTIEEIMGMDVDEFSSDDDVPEGRFSHLEAEKSVESWPVL